MPDVDAVERKRPKKGCLIGCGLIVVLLIGLGAFYGPTLANVIKVYGWDFWRKPAKHAYSATSEQNLKALYQGMVLYHESEGQFPQASSWMDAIRTRLLSNDLAKGQAEKKLVRPDLLGRDGEFGYAMNEAASGKYKDDIADPSKTPLIYESKQSSKNATGDGRSDRLGLAIAIDGTIMQVP